MSLPKPETTFVKGVGPQMGYKIHCSSCEEFLLVPRPSNWRRQDPDETVMKRRIERELDALGWLHKRNFNHITCPKCQPKEKPDMEKVVKMHADAPREITRDARRKIADLLESVYLVDKGCYSGKESDDSVAKTLNYPRAWVTDVRAMLFGDSGESEVGQAKSHELGLLEAKLNDIEKTFTNQIADLRAAINKARGELT